MPPGGGRRVVVETTCATTKDGFAEAAAKFDRSWPVVFETGTHCRWMERLFKSLGFRAIVANPALLCPVSLRGEKCQRMLRLHEARRLLMRMRTSAICQVRSVLIECANVVMKESARDTDLKLKGLRIGARGGSIARKKAKVAVAPRVRAGGGTSEYGLHNAGAAKAAECE